MRRKARYEEDISGSGSGSDLHASCESPSNLTELAGMVSMVSDWVIEKTFLTLPVKSQKKPIKRSQSEPIQPWTIGDTSFHHTEEEGRRQREIDHKQTQAIGP